MPEKEITYEDRLEEVQKRMEELTEENLLLDAKLILWKTNPKLAKLINMLGVVLHEFDQDKNFEFSIKVSMLYHNQVEVGSLKNLNHFTVYPDAIVLKMSNRYIWRLTENGVEKCPELD